MNPKDIIPVEKVYDDAFRPAMIQIGKAIESVTKTSRFLLAPFEYLAAQHDRWERYLIKVASKVEDINLVEGHPQIVIPVLEGLSLCSENSLLSELFVNLLSNSIDRTKQDLAHPAFPNIIKQLSHDEALILFFLKKQDYKMTQQIDIDAKTNRWNNHRKIYEEFPSDKLYFPMHFLLYMNHLHSLNLAGTYEIGDQEAVIDLLGNQTGSLIHNTRRLEEFGKFFADACVPNEFPQI
ncbi:Abi-alpha family protein [Agriterribacter humi]|uniref:Abi-alpha family protein n=1 Tax=Agriterribacter humi TaxID=1104781 RepID=UPI0012653953|nr:Abi-alpha family protein [Agriterribacter humi]